MGFYVKGLHDGPHVPLVCDRFSSVLGDLFNELPMPSALMPEVIVMVVCPTFLSHFPDEYLLTSSHLYEIHVRYDLSYSTNSHVSHHVLNQIHVSVPLNNIFNFCEPCKLGKMNRMTYVSAPLKTTQPFQLVPSSYPSPEGYKYYVSLWMIIPYAFGSSLYVSNPRYLPLLPHSLNT